MSDVILAMVVLGIIGITFAFFKMHAWVSEQEPLLSRFPAAESRALLTQYLVQQGFAVTYETADFVTFARNVGPRADTGCLFLFLGIVPGLLYFLLAGKSTTTTIVTRPRTSDSGSQIVVSGNDADARASIRRCVKQHLAP